MDGWFSVRKQVRITMITINLHSDKDLIIDVQLMHGNHCGGGVDIIIGSFRKECCDFIGISS